MVANGAIESAVTQGIGVATGLQKSFDWAAVAIGGVEAGAGGAVGGPLGTAAALLAGATTRSLLTGENFGQSLIQEAPNTVANTVGDALGGAIDQALNPSNATAVGNAVGEMYGDSEKAWGIGGVTNTAGGGTLVADGADPIGGLIDQYAQPTFAQSLTNSWDALGGAAQYASDSPLVLKGRLPSFDIGDVKIDNFGPYASLGSTNGVYISASVGPQFNNVRWIQVFSTNIPTPAEPSGYVPNTWVIDNNLPADQRAADPFYYTMPAQQVLVNSQFEGNGYAKGTYFQDDPYGPIGETTTFQTAAVTIDSTGFLHVIQVFGYTESHTATGQVYATTPQAVQPNAFLQGILNKRYPGK